MIGKDKTEAMSLFILHMWIYSCSKISGHIKIKSKWKRLLTFSGFFFSFIWIFLLEYHNFKNVWVNRLRFPTIFVQLVKTQRIFTFRFFNDIDRGYFLKLELLLRWIVTWNDWTCNKYSNGMRNECRLIKIGIWINHKINFHISNEKLHNCISDKTLKCDLLLSTDKGRQSAHRQTLLL